MPWRTPPNRSVECRKRADEAREKADATKDAETRKSLLLTADTWERMAEYEGYIRDGKYKEVEPLLAEYVKERPKSSWGWYALGYSRFAQQKIGESIQALAKSL